jgi:hypothetical protein
MKKRSPFLGAKRFFLSATLVQIINILVHYCVLRDRAILGCSSAAGLMSGIIAVGYITSCSGFSYISDDFLEPIHRPIITLVSATMPADPIDR